MEFTNTPEAKEATMFEIQVRQFASEFPTPNVLRAIAYCEAGTLTWEQVYGIFCTSLKAGLEAVA